MSVPFVKMHALGNDCLFINDQQNHNIRALLDRRRGVGADQVFFWTQTKDADAQFVIYNNDGSPAQACGNGTRCLVALVTHRTGKTKIVMQGPAGKFCGWMDNNGQQSVVQQEKPQWGIRHNGMIQHADPIDLHSYGLGVGLAVDAGNPHLLIEAPFDPQKALALTHHPAFPNGVNVSFFSVAGHRICAQVAERGAGITLGCGSAAAALGWMLEHRTGQNPVCITMPGGCVDIWTDDYGLYSRSHVYTICQGVAFVDPEYAPFIPC